MGNLLAECHNPSCGDKSNYESRYIYAVQEQHGSNRPARPPLHSRRRREERYIHTRGGERERGAAMSHRSIRTSASPLLPPDADADAGRAAKHFRRRRRRRQLRVAPRRAGRPGERGQREIARGCRQTRGEVGTQRES